MALFQQINDDLKAAMKSGDRARVDVLRFSLAGLNAAQKDKGMKEPGATLTDDEVVANLQKEAKRRRESIELFKQGNRTDLVEKEEADLAVIMGYLPKELTREEIERTVLDLKAKGFADFNSLMRESMKVLKGRADGKLVGDVVKANVG
ncbi:MAG TPA: GatB/YqeY domain-containing protein [Candidatus Paceibacterota bacterium]|nr:GatB/YqeY domain-containing protein [Candidatus Paceibacterota bacterium]